MYLRKQCWTWRGGVSTDSSQAAGATLTAFRRQSNIAFTSNRFFTTGYGTEIHRGNEPLSLSVCLKRPTAFTDKRPDFWRVWSVMNASSQNLPD
ncbi:MAG: hypothetical protein HY774_05875 [Acidobacteria bacterium]|nr:hypothetical protein [Acidobacteriota bacterium]